MVIPFIELIAGALVILGLRTREALVALGFVGGQWEYAPKMTADGVPFDPAAVYFFPSRGGVADSAHFTRIDFESLGEEPIPFETVEICRLRLSRDDALEDAQKLCLNESRLVSMRSKNTNKRFGSLKRKRHQMPVRQK